ncbi:hypothetical protein Tco_0845112 [Tanacetum coccineum]
MRECRLRWFGHVKRRTHSALVRRVESITVEDLGRWGRPKFRWEDRLKINLEGVLLSDDMSSIRNSKASRTKTRPTPVLDMLANAGTSRDSDGNMQDPFVGVEASQDRYPTHDESTHWRIQSSKLGLKFETASKLKESLTYYALANGFSIEDH